MTLLSTFTKPGNPQIDSVNKPFSYSFVEKRFVTKLDFHFDAGAKLIAHMHARTFFDAKKLSNVLDTSQPLEHDNIASQIDYLKKRLVELKVNKLFITGFSKIDSDQQTALLNFKSSALCLFDVKILSTKHPTKEFLRNASGSLDTLSLKKQTAHKRKSPSLANTALSALFLSFSTCVIAYAAYDSILLESVAEPNSPSALNQNIETAAFTKLEKIELVEHKSFYPTVQQISDM